MAVIGRITGVALEPGVSANGRLYTPAMVAGAAEVARERIANGGLPLTMLTHHAAEDDSTRITGHITSVDVRPDGALTYEADVVGNPAGEAVLAAAESGALQSVSIRGKFTGPVKTISHEGQQVVTAEGLELDGVDWTRQPGVKGARVTSVSRMARESAKEAHRVICESLPTPAVERITEDLPDDLVQRVTEARDAAEAYLSVRGTTGPATVSVSAAPLGNEDVSGAAAALGQAFQAAMRSLDPDMDDDMHLPDGSELQDPFGGAFDDYQSHPDDASASETEAPVADDSTTETEAAETEAPQVPALAEADMVRLADMVAERLRPAADPAPAVETTEAEVVDPAAVAREAATAAVGEAVTGIGESLAGKVAEAVAGVKDDIRRELISSGVVTPRAGLVATAEAAPEKPLHEMDRDERNQFYAERFEIAFAGGRPMAAQRA